MLYSMLSVNKQEFTMSEEEMNQCECQECQCCEEQKTPKKRTTTPYDICAIIFCIFPVLAELFTINFHDASSILHQSLKALELSLFPLVIAIIGVCENERKNDTSHIALTFVIMIDIIYAMILLFGFLEGGKLFG